MTGYTYTVEATKQGDTKIVATGLSLTEANDVAYDHATADTAVEIWIEQTDQHVKTIGGAA